MSADSTRSETIISLNSIYMLQQYAPSYSGCSVITNTQLIEERAKDIEIIEEDTREIFDIIRNLDRIVDDQDDDIMLIEDSVIQAHVHTKKATTHLKKTNKKKKKKRWCQITGVLVGVLLIIGGILILAL